MINAKFNIFIELDGQVDGFLYIGGKYHFEKEWEKLFILLVFILLDSIDVSQFQRQSIAKPFSL